LKSNLNVKVTVEEPSSVKRKVAIEVPAEDVDRYFRDTLKEYRRQAVIPGFRKGKAPMSVIESRFRGDVAEEVARNIVPESYEKALEESGLKPISEPKVGDLGAVEEGKPLTYTAEFEVLPEFELKDYLGLEIESPEFEVKDEEVDAILEEMRGGQATVSRVAEARGLRTGDVAMIDFEGITDGQPIPGGSAKDFPLTIGSDTFLPGFEDALIGIAPGEEREFFLALPDDFQEAALAGKEAQFKVNLKEIRERVLPELDDDFAKDVGDYENLEVLKERLRTNILHTKELTSRNELKEKLIAKLVEDNPFEVPQAMIIERQAQMIASVERNLLMRGVPKEDVEKGREKMFGEAVGPAELKVRASLILEAVADKEEIVVSTEELNNEIKKIAEQNRIDPGEARRRMVQNGALENLKEVMREDKTVAHLLEKASVTTGSATEKGKE
jgi:trigger factor